MSEHSGPLCKAHCAHSPRHRVSRSVVRSFAYGGPRVLLARPRAGMCEHVRSVAAVVLPGRPFRYQHAVLTRMPSTGEGTMEAAPLTGLRGGQPRPPVIYHRRLFGSSLLRCSLYFLAYHSVQARGR